MPVDFCRHLVGLGKVKRRVPELIPVLRSQPAGDVSHKPGGRLPLLSARPALYLIYTTNLRHLTQRIMSCCAQSGDRFLTIDSVTSFRPVYTQSDSDVISFHIYASWFSPPSCG